MTEESDEADRIEQIARWLLDNHERQNRPLIKLIAQSWPDATAAELAQAWDRMIETAMETVCAVAPTSPVLSGGAFLQTR